MAPFVVWKSFEGEIAADTATLLKVQKALEKAGVEFLNHERETGSTSEAKK